MPSDDPSIPFPKIDDITRDYTCKCREVDIEGEKGIFYGPFSKKNSHPDGYGVFINGDWINCGKVKDGTFTAGRRVSVNSKQKVLKLVNTKILADQTVLQKVERYAPYGTERSFTIDG